MADGTVYTQEKLVTLRDQCMQQLIDITLNPKPSYTKGDQTVNWTYHKKELEATIEFCNKQLERFEGNGPIHETVEYTV